MNKWNQKRRTMQRYDLTVHMYDARYAQEQALKYQAALKLLNITRHSNVLDVGCGTGLLFRSIKVETGSVVGVDISRLSLLQAKKRARILQNCHLIQADADSLPFRNGCFNIVFAFTVLQNMPKPFETLFEIKRNMRCGASVVVTGLKKVFALNTFMQLIKKAGFSLISIKDDDFLKCFIAFLSLN
jgi:ubiquinone/menaquinone biosynthesis C-methylase UbiE